MRHFPIPQYHEVSAANRKYFDFFRQKLGSVPNLYSMLARSESALDAYYKLHEHAQSLNTIERAVIGILVASLNESVYCLETHKMIARLNRLSEEEVNEIVDGTILFNERCHHLSRLVTEIVISKGKPREKTLQRFFDAGYTTENLVDVILCIADTTFTNLLTCS
ncbi:carboxymuconolactone decarboxylase family protein, partial [Arachidicoccus sp.]|uniref:carboxymuconolactone decarboxylase family protein n=1 Tax=Arachidicoccus sp. TaxID=1872624 RepID=UPI003D1DD715